MSTPITDWLAGAGASVPARGGRPAKGHTGRQRKVHCVACGVILYGSRTALQRSGLPVCGCGEKMTLANLRDRALVEWDTLETELVLYGREAYDAAMRELGYPVERVARVQRSGLVQHRCEASGCHKFSAAHYCDDCKDNRPQMATARKGRG